MDTQMIVTFIEAQGHTEAGAGVGAVVPDFTT